MRKDIKNFGIMILLISKDSLCIKNIERICVANEWSLDCFTSNFDVLKIDYLYKNILFIDTSIGSDLAFSICEKHRTNSNIPIIMAGFEKREELLECVYRCGADKYIEKKPETNDFFLLEEKISSIIRLKYSVALGDEKKYMYKNLYLDMSAFKLEINEIYIKTPFKELCILELFLKKPKKIYSIDEIFEYAWQENAYNNSNASVMTYICSLRKKLKLNSSIPKILNLSGRGYYLE